MIRHRTVRTALPHPLFRLVITCVAALSMLLGLQATGAWADEPITWSAAPATAEGTDGRVSLRHELDPGASVQDYIAVTNDSAVTATFTVAAGDGVMSDNGAFDVSTDAPSDGGSWFTIDGLDGDQLVLAAGETRVLPLTISVPTQATPGDHPAGVVVALVSQADGIRATHRVGVRAHLRVTGEVTAHLGTRITSTRYVPSLVPFAPGVVRVEAQVVNTGNVRLGAGAELTSKGLFGVGATSARTDHGLELLPGGTGTMVVETRAWPTIVGAASLELTPSVIGQDSVELPASRTHAVWFFAPNWTGLVIVAVCAVVAGSFLRLRRRLKQAQADAALNSAPITG